MDFQDYQKAFAAHVRDPGGVARPAGVNARRMRVYDALLFNNIESFLLACFPVCRQVLGKRRWTRLVRAFFREHVCATPYFRRIPEEFLGYLESTFPRSEDYPDFLPELAHYEWVELDLDTSDRDAELPAHDPEGDLSSGRPLPNPAMRVLAYRYPVHRISPRHKPSRPASEATFLLAFRDADLGVRFVAINAATARLLTLLRDDEELSGDAALAQLAAELNHPDPAALRRYGAGLLATLRERGALLGCRV
jgi:hypothetical protein